MVLSFWFLFIFMSHFVSFARSEKDTKATDASEAQLRTDSSFARALSTQETGNVAKQADVHDMKIILLNKNAETLEYHSNEALLFANHDFVAIENDFTKFLRKYGALVPKQNQARSGSNFLDYHNPIGGHRPAKNGQGNLFALSMYYGNCPVESRKVARRVDSLYICRQGGNFECDKECENRFDDDDEEVLGGRCLSPSGRSHGRSYGGYGGYTGYGGVCVCYYCKGMGVSDTKCMEEIETKQLPDERFTHPLCDIQSNTFDERPGYDDDIFREDENDGKDNERTGFGPTPYGHPGLFGARHSAANRGPRTHAISSKRCNAKCMLLYSNAEKGICKRGSGYHYECHCKTCGLAESFLPNDSAPGNESLVAKTVNCADYTPIGQTFDVFLPLPLPVQVKACDDGQVLNAADKCLGLCLKNFMHYPIFTASCADLNDRGDDDNRKLRSDRFRGNSDPTVEHRCVCSICVPPPCIYDSWNDWSYCSVRCNGGTRRRKRNLIVGDKGECTNVLEYRSCSEYPCSVDCVVSQWAEWGHCGGHCGTGSEIRERQMLVPPLYSGKCYHNQFIDYRQCDTGKECDNYRPQPQYSHVP